MAYRTVFVSLLISQPIATCIVLFTSKLIAFIRGPSQTNRNFYEDSTRRLSTLIWWLQAVVALDSALLVGLDIFALFNTHFIPRIKDVQDAHLASNIALVLYFVAGLLPDPDEKLFSPCISNCHAWLTVAAFEIPLIWLQAHAIPVHETRYSDLLMAAEACRLLALLLQSAFFLLFNQGSKGQNEDQDSYQRLINGSQGPDYDSVAKNPKTASKSSTNGDAQTTGWLDYFVGFRALFPYFWPSDSRKQQLITLFCFGLLVAQRVFNVLVPYQLGVLVAALGQGSIPYKELALYCLYRAMQGQQGIIGSFRAILWIPISQQLYRRLTSDAYEHVMGLSLDFHLSKRIGEVMSALSKGGALNTFLDGFAFQLFPMVFDLGVAAVYLFVRFNAFYSIITVSVLWSYVFVTIYMAKYRGRQRRTMINRDREMEAIKTDTLLAYEIVHQNSALPTEMSRLAGYIDSFQQAEFAVLFSLNALNAVQNLIFVFGVVLIAVLSAYDISAGTATVASFVAVITYFAQLQAPLAFFGSFYTQVQNNLVDAERMLDLFNRVPDITDRPDAYLMPPSRGHLEFRNVDFSYNDREPTLKKVSFTVPSGSTTAIVGESGSGKSTCMKLIFRFYDVQKGSILLDSRDIREVTVQSLRQHIGVVPQDTLLFNETCMYNLKYGRPGASDEEVYDACRAASIHERILSFPNGYATLVGERGMKLSGGEKQRVAIARAILKRPAVTLLDEATASLDSQTERQVQASLNVLTKDRTTIVIAHRLSTITSADQILVMHSGEIVERGTHRDLLQRQGRYAALWDKQTRDVKDSEAP